MANLLMLIMEICHMYFSVHIKTLGKTGFNSVQRLFVELLHVLSKEMQGIIRGCIYTKDKTCENRQLETQ